MKIPCVPFFIATILLHAAPPIPLDNPYVKMYTEVDRVEEARAVNHLPPAELNRKLDDLTRWYNHFHCEASRNFTMGDASADASGITLAAKLAKRGALVSNYRNGTYVSQANAGDITSGEAAMLERTAPLAIGDWWPGPKDPYSGSDRDEAARLSVALESDETEVRLTSPARYKPGGAPDTWPYVPSRGAGADPGPVFSANTHDFVSWVRVEDEIMRVRGVMANGAEIILIVDRGYFRTAKSRHASGQRVFSPIYIGGKAARPDFRSSGPCRVEHRGDNGSGIPGMHTKNVISVIRRPLTVRRRRTDLERMVAMGGKRHRLKPVLRKV
jgi:hypothetical protein